MNHLNLQDIYCVSDQRALADDTMLDEWTQRCGKLPDGYAEFVSTLGFGTLGSICVLASNESEQATADLRESLQAWADDAEEFEHPFVVPESSTEDAVALATSDWGEYYFSSPSDPGVLWYIDRPHDWDNATTFLPHGFRNLFLHQNVDGSTFNRREGEVVFHPSRPVESIHVHLTGRTEETNSQRSVEAVAQTLRDHYEITHRMVEHDVHFLFVKSMGAELRVGYHPRYQSCFLYAVVDAQYARELDALKAFMSDTGYDIRDHAL